MKKHWIAILIIIAGTFLRTYQLNTHAIFFGDIARDIIVANESVQEGTIPLLGIPSSMPRFRQGPLSIWLIMTLNILFVDNLFMYSIFFAAIGIAAMIFIYEMGLTQFNKKIATFSLFLLSFSPLAIAHSRMVYHITPTPLLVVLFLWSLNKLWKKEKKSLFLVGFSAALVFQTELSLFPLFFMIPYVLWRSGQLKLLSKPLAGIIVGLTPQIIYDITHNFSQLGMFVVWLGYRGLSAFIPSKHSLGSQKVISTFINFNNYFKKIWSTDSGFIHLVMMIILIISIIGFWKMYKKNKLKPQYETVLISTLLITVGYIIHGTPSEAYFPVYFILIPLIIAIGITSFNKTTQYIVGILFIIFAASNTLSIFKHNFFVSNTQKFSYGPSVQEQKNIVDHIKNTSNRYQLKTSSEGGKFAAYFDNLRYFASKNNLTEDNNNGHIFYIETEEVFPILSWGKKPKINKKTFESMSVYSFSTTNSDNTK